MTTWCILRTSGARTLPLSRSLAAAGFQVWTPTATAKRRLPRRPSTVDQPAAMMPTFVFASAEALAELSRLSRSPVSKHPAFSIFRFDGRIPLLHDREIERVRAIERQAVPARRRPTVPVGATVRPDQGAYAGLDGIVKQSDGHYTLVAFGGWMDVKIETFLLTGDDVSDAPASTGIAA